jgi:D-3-phosphoglycerate dehydrogenase
MENNREIILIGPTTFGAFDPAPLRKIVDAGYEVRRNPVGRKMSEADLAQALDGVVGIIAGLEPLTEKILAQSQLQVVSRCGVGLDSVDVAAAKRLGIQVYSTPNAPTVAVAELTIGAMICMLRRVSQMDQKMHTGGWEKLSGPQLRDKTVTIVGLGRIGLQVASYLKAFGVHLLGVDPFRQGMVEGIPVVTLDEALTQSHIISVHASGSAEILGAREFERVCPGVYVINTGRGGLINETALQKALDDGKVAGAWLDAFAEEPYQGPLKNYKQVVLTPHVGYSSDEARRQMEIEAVDNLLKGLSSPSARNPRSDAPEVPGVLDQ